MKHALQKANRDLEKLAHYDGLNQILNRRGFDESLDRYCKQMLREKADLALLLIDVDHFKLFNDNYSHLKGDDCLKDVAQALEKSLLRPIDIAARYGGEEFAILLPNTGLDGAQHVAQRLLESVRKLGVPHEFSSAADDLTVSMGIALSKESSSPENLITQAD